ncbi:MAG: transcription antitermination factor NusB [Eubacteriales bacterium]|nr:transcription antitermination factor NusB [Eubacteriales bacterium]
MGRRELREHIFKLLFMSDFNDGEEMNDQLVMYFDGLGVLKENDQSYMQSKYEKIKEHLAEIDALLNEKSKGWKTSRMSKVDLSILRLAVYEIKFDEDVPVKVAINEAVEIAKAFGGDTSASFVNGILGKIAKDE